MKTINLDSATAKQAIEETPAGEIFRANKTVGGTEKVFYGYVSADTGVFWMTNQDTGPRITQDDAEYFVDLALGNIYEVEEEYPTPEEEYWADFAIHARRRKNEDEEDLPFHHPDYMENYKGGRI